MSFACFTFRHAVASPAASAADHAHGNCCNVALCGPERSLRCGSEP
jgi:hypothetical protein